MGVLNFVSLIFSFFATGLSLYLYFKFARPQAQLATIEKEEIKNRHMLSHRQELKKWFFEKIKEDLVGTGTLNENAVFDGVTSYIGKLNRISKGPDLEDHWKNGMKHLNIDDSKLYGTLDPIGSTLMDLDKGTDQLNNLIEEKINKLIEPTRFVDQFNSLSPGKIVKKTFLILIKNELEGFLTWCPEEKGDLINCLKKQSPSDLVTNDKGYIVKGSTSFALQSSDFEEKKVKFIIDTVEKDDELLKKMIEIRNQRTSLGDKLVEIRDGCTTIIEKIDSGTYHTVAECCPKK